MNDRILITGATGFLGRYIVTQLLASGYKNILAISSRSLDQLDKIAGVEYKQCDIMDVTELNQYVQGVDKIIHAAGFISYHKRDYKQLLGVNAKGTENVSNLAIEHQVSQLIYISSIAAFPKHALRNVLSEKDRFNDRSFSSNYGMTKYIGESHVWRAEAEGVNVCILNPALIIGSGDWQKGTPNFFEKINSGLKYYPSGGNGVVYAADIAKFIILALEGKAPDPQYVLSAENLRYKTLFDKIAHALSKPKPRFEIKGIKKYLARIVDTVQSTMLGHPRYLSRESLANISEVKQFDNSLSLTVNGFSYTSIDEAIEMTAAEFAQQAH